MHTFNKFIENIDARRSWILVIAAALQVVDAVNKRIFFICLVFLAILLRAKIKKILQTTKQ